MNVITSFLPSSNQGCALILRGHERRMVWALDSISASECITSIGGGTARVCIVKRHNTADTMSVILISLQRRRQVTGSIPMEQE